jgi:hypothetical protein
MDCCRYFSEKMKSLIGLELQRKNMQTKMQGHADQIQPEIVQPKAL